MQHPMSMDEDSVSICVDLCVVGVSAYGSRDASHRAVGRRWANAFVALVNAIHPEVLESSMRMHSGRSSQGSDERNSSHI